MPKDLDVAEWMLIDQNQWDFGIKVRGVIRKVMASVYFDEEKTPSWIWLTHINGNQRGAEGKLQWAIQAAEDAMGIEPGT